MDVCGNKQILSLNQDER